MISKKVINLFGNYNKIFGSRDINKLRSLFEFNINKCIYYTIYTIQISKNFYLIDEI